MTDPIPEFDGRSFEELEVAEHPTTGQLMFRDVLRRRKRDGSWEEVPVQLRVPRTSEYLQARASARDWIREAKLDEERDKDLFEQLEQVCLLSTSVRDKDGAQLAGAQELLNQYDEASLDSLLKRLNELKELLDPRRQEPGTEEEVIQMVVAVRGSASLRPLTGIAPGAQRTWLLRMADLAYSSEPVQRWLQSAVSSTPAH